MQSHTVLQKFPNEVVQQAQHPVDVSKDYDLLVKVRDGVVHTYAKNSTKKIDSCIECDRYEAFMQAAEDRRLAEEE